MTRNTDDSGHEVLVFTLGAEEYGIDILKVQEIRRYEAVTHIPDVPAHIKGVINLRGVIVPIVDMRARFNLDRAEIDQQTVVIILNLGARVVGMMVDRVSNVTTLTAEQISPAPKFGLSVNAEYLKGLATVDGRMLILADVEKLMAVDESIIEAAAA